MKSFAKKFLGIALAAVLLLGVLPTAASAAGFKVQFIKDESAGTFFDDCTLDSADVISAEAYNKATAAANAILYPQGLEVDHWEEHCSNPVNVVTSGSAVTRNMNLKYTTKAHKHTPSDSVQTAPTCTTVGTKNVVCSVCGATIETGVEIPATGHTWGEYVVEKAATSSSEGLETRTCTVCGAKESRAIPVADSPITVWKLSLDENKPAEFKNSAVTTYEIKDGQRIGSLFAKGMPIPACNLYVFRGWYLTNPDGTETNIRVTSESVYDYGRNVTLKAKWAREARVNLMIYRNGRTDTPYDVVPLYGYAVGDVIYTKDINIKSYYNNGGKPFDFAGWYDRGGWTLFKAKDNPKPASAIETVDLNGDTTLFCMITDNNAPAGNKNPDRTNPKTGDESMIIATTAVMLASAGALAVIFMDRKRRNG